LALADPAEKGSLFRLLPREKATAAALTRSTEDARLAFESVAKG